MAGLRAVYLNRSSLEAETLLYDGCELANATSLLAQHVLGTSGQDDNLSTGRRVLDLNARVTRVS
jgi:hypothetical protein